MNIQYNTTSVNKLNKISILQKLSSCCLLATATPALHPFASHAPPALRPNAITLFSHDYSEDDGTSIIYHLSPVLSVLNKPWPTHVPKLYIYTQIVTKLLDTLQNKIMKQARWKESVNIWFHQMMQFILLQHMYNKKGR